MKRIQNHIWKFIGCSLLAWGFFSCNDSWDDYYSLQGNESDEVEIYTGDIVEYIKKQPDLAQMSSLLEQSGIYDSIHVPGGYTIIVCTDQVLGAESPENKVSFAKNSVSDIAVSPTKLTDGFGISTRSSKNVWVSIKENGDIYFDNYKLERQVKTQNGYVYYVNGVIPVRPSIYEFFKTLGDDYSYFVSLVDRFEENYFDKDKSTPVSVDAMGNTEYDTVMTVRNTLIDRYTEDGLKSWDMFSEDFLSTMFIPSNDLLTNAIETALENVPRWLNREATEADLEKFEEWIVRACFVDRRLDAETVSAGATEDIPAVEGCRQIIDITQDAKNYEPVDAAVWRPSVQVVDNSNPVALSNGVAYYVQEFKIPNHVVIYRVKSKFYELWGAMTDQQKSDYFRWTNWIEPMIVNDAQTEFTLSETLPTMYYHVLTAIPTARAIADSAICSVTYDGLLYNSATRKLVEANLPAGEYYLRMGFKHSLRYSIDIYFNDDLLVEDMYLLSTGVNFHFDRGSVSDLDFYGSSSIGFPEGFNWREWIELDEKAVGYDTDGYQVAIVNIPEDGNFTITIDSKDNAYLYDDTNGRSKNNVTQLMMYHWCLRPTTRNY